MSVPRLRSPGKKGASSNQSAFASSKAAQDHKLAQQQGKVMPIPQLKSALIPAYTQEELDLDIVTPNKYLFYYERSVVCLSFLAMSIYMGWRWSAFVTHPSSYWISAPLILAETSLVIPGLFISYFMIWHRILRPRKRLSNMPLSDAEKPTIDVMIPCYTEPVEIIRDTLVAACAMDYPIDKITVNVCDDGKNRDDVRALVDAVREENKARGNHVVMRYFRRVKEVGKPHHAKAGNLNNAILNEGTTGQFLVIFDCDMVAEPHFLDALIPHFYTRTGEDKYEVDPNIALIQSPQSFFGVPLNDPLGQQYRYFYGPVLQGWDGADSAPCCGTNVIFSRACLTAVGGFIYGSVTEDFLTSMYLHNAGFKTKYVHEYLARGLSPESLHDFMKQRLRWAGGAVEIFFYHNSIWRQGLSLKQKYLYFWAGLQALLGFPLLLVCIVPFIALGNPGIAVAPVDAGEYLYFMGAFMTFTIWMLLVSYRDVPKLYLMRSVQESVFMLFCKMDAVFKVLRHGKMVFAVTNKDAQESQIKKEFGHIIPHIIYYLLAGLCVARVAYNSTLPNFTQEKLLGQGVSCIWIAVVLWQLYPPIGMVFGEFYDSLKRPAGGKAAPAMADDGSDPRLVPVTPKLPSSP